MHLLHLQSEVDFVKKDFNKSELYMCTVITEHPTLFYYYTVAPEVTIVGVAQQFIINLTWNNDITQIFGI